MECRHAELRTLCPRACGIGSRQEDHLRIQYSVINKAKDALDDYENFYD